MIRKLKTIAITTSIVGISSLHAVADAAPRARFQAQALKANDSVQLDGGEKISAAKYAEEMNQLQEALEKDGVSLHKADHKPPPKALPLYPGANEEKERDKAVVAQKIQKLSLVEAGGFSALRHKRLLGAKGAFFGKAGGGVPARADRPSKAATGKDDDDDALDVTYDETLGSKKRAAIYVGLVLKDTGEKDSVGCDATVDGGIYVFDKKAQLVKLTASGKIASASVSGGLDLFLLGKSVGGFPKKGSSNVAFSKAIAPPAAKMKYGWGPISVNVEGSIASELKLNAANNQQGPSTSQKGRCALSAEPTVRASAKVTASVSAIAYKVGVEGQIVLIELGAPMAASVTVRDSPATMTEDFRASVKGVFLDGDVAFFVKTRIPQSGERFWDVDWDQVYRKMLFDWDGLKIDSKLASFSGKQTSL
jgi:hypothetical protein